MAAPLGADAGPRPTADVPLTAGLPFVKAVAP
jgi:hypothetical protein